MKDSYRNFEVLKNEEIFQNIYRLELKGSLEVKPGQFFMLRAWKGVYPFLSRPISISDVKEDSLVFLYERRGQGTDLFSDLKTGDEMEILGPLGNGFEDIDAKKIALVSGGVGIAPLLYLAKNLRGRVDLFAGFRSGKYYVDEFKGYVDEIKITSEDGSEGEEGFITKLLNPEDYDLIIACGPTPMMEAVEEISKDRRRIYSLESRMACGVGACAGCTIRTKHGLKKVCKDGPVFEGDDIFEY